MEDYGRFSEKISFTQEEKPISSIHFGKNSNAGDGIESSQNIAIPSRRRNEKFKTHYQETSKSIRMGIEQDSLEKRKKFKSEKVIRSENKKAKGIKFSRSVQGYCYEESSEEELPSLQNETLKQSKKT